MRFTYLILVLFILSGTTYAKKISVSGKIKFKGLENANLKISEFGNFKKVFFEKNILKSEKYSFSLEINQPTILDVFLTYKESGHKARKSAKLIIDQNNSIDFIINKKVFDLKFKRKDKNNKALNEYLIYSSEKAKLIWKKPPEIEKSKQFVSEIIAYKNQVINKYNITNKELLNFLETSSFIDYRKNLNSLHYFFRRKLGRNYKFPKGFLDFTLPVEKFLDNDISIKFYSSYIILKQYIFSKSNSDIEQSILYLNSNFKNKILKQDFIQKLLKSYISNYVISKSFENDIKIYENWLQNIENKEVAENLLNQFKNLKYTAQNSELPNLILKDANGKSVKLKDLKGKVLYIDLWASWCKPCCAEVPYLQKIEKEYKENNNIHFVSISLDKSEKSWKNKMKQLNMHGTQLIVGDSKLSEVYNIKGIPHFMIYDKQGKLFIYKAPRPSNKRRLTKILNDLISK